MQARMRASARDPWRTLFVLAFVVLTALKVSIAATLAPFVDEAFYWQESRHPAWSYSDVPALTAWLIRIGETALGHSVLAMRVPFLILGAAIVVLIVRMAADLGGSRAGWQAGLWVLILPLAGTLGVLALPDVPLTFAAVLGLYAFGRAARGNRRSDWILLGVALAIGWLSHYRAAMLLLAGIAFLVATPRGRSLWRTPGLWIALAISALGLLPMLAFNVGNDWAAAGFQFVERHPWTFQGASLLQPIEQALVTTPLLYGLLLAVLIAALRRSPQGAPWDLFGWAALVPIVVYFAIGLFADGDRFRVHWPLAGYLPLLVLLVLLGREWIAHHRSLRWLIGGAAVMALSGTLAVLSYFAAAASPALASQLTGLKLFPKHLVGWNESAAATRVLLDDSEFADSVLVADNFMLAAQLDFAFGGRQRIYVLDNPLNARHGRAHQLALWSRDENALRAQGARGVLLVVEETALRERDRSTWLNALCARVDMLRLVQRVDLYDGRKRFALFSGVRRDVLATGMSCAYPSATALTEP